jgi:signal transduction histidine kinase
MTVIALVVVLAHLALVTFVYLHRYACGNRFRWLAAAILASAIAVAMFLFLGDTVGFSLILTIALVVALAGFGVVVFDDPILRPSPVSWKWIWLGGNGLWLVLLVVAILTNASVGVGQQDWLERAVESPGALGLLVLIGLVTTSFFLASAGFYNFYRAPLPEIANRALFWVFNTAMLYLGGIMLASGIRFFVPLGMVILFVSMVQAADAVISHRIWNARSALDDTARAALFIAIATLVILAALQLTYQMDKDKQTALVLVVVALVTASVNVMVYHLADFLLHRLASGRELDSVQVVQTYGQRLSESGSLEVLSASAAEQVNQFLRVRRSGLLLVSGTTDESIILSVIPGGGFSESGVLNGHLSMANALYKTLAVERRTVTLFDLEYNAAYANLAGDERQFMRGLQMVTYAPIVSDNRFIGILAAGPKRNRSAHNTPDLRLLEALAQQTGIALRNARLVADLRHLNDSMKSLNTGLESAKEELEKLDSVKTDFITIASHELRTPLAQIRGYTDIIEALNEQGMLDQEQLAGFAVNLRKATERTEELITAMLDVSQIDVNAMDLRFAQTTLESVMRLAIEPLTDAIRQRKLTLTARGLRGLPPIQGDMQRLVQAFRNVIVNAVKFTPDGGRIEIMAALQEADRKHKNDLIQITIKDTGVGIAPEHHELIFTKFYRVGDPSLHSTGTYKFMGAGPGLGLTIARGIIEGHGGRIWVESEAFDQQACPGAAFYVELPLSPPEDAKRVLPFAGDSASSTD